MSIAAVRPARRPFAGPIALFAALVVALFVGSTFGVGGWSLSAAHAQDAADPTTPAGPPSTQWALTPSGEDPTQPGQRTTLGYESAPGSTVDDSVTVWNYGSQPIGITLYGTDAFTTAEGVFDLLREDQPASDVGTWVRLQQQSIIVAAQSGTVVPLTLIIPTDASPGDHAGGIVASSEQRQFDGSGNAVSVVQRVGVPLYLRVSGDLHPALAIEGITTSYSRSEPGLSGDLDVTYTVRNVGNVRLSGRQHVAAKGPLGWVLAERALDDLPELLPGASLTRSAHLTGVAPALRVSAVVTVEPVSPVDGGLSLDTVSRSSSFWAVPWVLVGLVVAAVVLVRWRRARNRRKPPSAPVPLPESLTAPALAGGSADPGDR